MQRRKALPLAVVLLSLVARTSWSEEASHSSEATSSVSPLWPAIEIHAAPPDPQSQEFRDDWYAYVKEATRVRLQEECQPVRLFASPSVPFKGTILLLHGFSACPQQFKELAKGLNQQGYEVLLPLAPGHGRAWSSRTGQDDTSGIPNAWNWEAQYTNYVDQMNRLMAKAKGDKQVGGLSLGGALTLLAAERQPKLYQRILVLTPFLDLSRKATTLAGPFKEPAMATLYTLGHLPLLGDIPLGWGKTCETEERQLGRAGICQFKTTHVLALQSLGSHVLKRVDQIQSQGQLVGVAGDPVVSAEKIRQLGESLQKRLNVGSAFCEMPSNTNHSLLSRFDSPHENKFWVAPLLDRLTDYFTLGKPLPSKGFGCESKP